MLKGSKEVKIPKWLQQVVGVIVVGGILVYIVVNEDESVPAIQNTIGAVFYGLGQVGEFFASLAGAPA